MLWNKDELKKLCRRHLKEETEAMPCIEKKLLAWHIYHLSERPTALCIEKTKTPCSEEVETNHLQRIDYIANVKGLLTNNTTSYKELPRLLKELERLSEIHLQRIGFESLLLLLKQIREIKVRDKEAFLEVHQSIEKERDALLFFLNEKISSSHYVVRMLIRDIIKEIFSIWPKSLIESHFWSEQARTEISLCLTECKIGIEKNELLYLNDKKRGDVLVKILLKTNHSAYSDQLLSFEPMPVGSRNIRILSSKLPEPQKEELFSYLAGKGCLNAIYFISKWDGLINYAFLLDSLPKATNEEIRVEYFDALLQKCLSHEKLLPLVYQWLLVNQIIETKENQKRCASLFVVFLRKMRSSFLRKYAFLLESGQEHQETVDHIEVFKKLVNIVLEMCQGTNINRHLLGLNYLLSISQIKESPLFLSEEMKKNIVFTLIKSPNKETRSTASGFSLTFSMEELKESFYAADSSVLHGAILLFLSQKRSSEEINHLISFCISILSNSPPSLPHTHKAIHVLWSVYNASFEEKILLEGTRINPFIVSENRKAEDTASSFHFTPKYVISTQNAIRTIYQEKIISFFDASLSVLQTREIYSSSLSLVSSPDMYTDEEYLYHWYILRECMMYMLVYGIVHRDISVIKRLSLSLFTVGGHLGNIMIASESIQTLLLFLGSTEEALSLCKDLLKEIEIKRFKTVRRDGGIPYLFKALCAHEANEKKKTCTHFLFFEVIKKSFSLIKNIQNFTLIRKHLDASFLTDETLFSSLSMDSEEKELEITNAEMLFHYMNILKELASDGIFKYEVKKYEPYLFLLCISMISHTNWKIRNASLMLFSTLIKKMCGESLNDHIHTKQSRRYSKVSVLVHSREILLDALSFYHKKNNESGVFPVLVFFSRLPELLLTESLILKDICKDNAYSLRVNRKLSLLLELQKEGDPSLTTISEQEEVEIKNAHITITESTAEKINLFVNFYNELISQKDNLKKAFNSSEGKIEEVLSHLDLLGTEEKHVRDFLLSSLPDNISRDSILYLLFSSYSSMLLKEKLLLLLPKEENSSSIFLRERENLFRDIPHELFLLRISLQEPHTEAI
ncbi:hypothetical protein NEFER03_1829 [Nematocida sp. LUAm3]|nr:hypothetical protein NEFER03_1829 [Nematocida sp. LUAm3]KAI5177391.1 hypothetical protein NEFER01_0666 [Nematocida sp. LUAm1]